MTNVTVPDTHRDLADEPTVGVLSTLGGDGRPQSTAVWFLLDGDAVRMSLLTSRQKYKNLSAHPHGTLFVLDPTNPYRTLEVRGDVTFEEDPDLAFFERIIRAYGQDPDTFPAPREGAGHRHAAPPPDRHQRLTPAPSRSRSRRLEGI